MIRKRGLSVLLVATWLAGCVPPNAAEGGKAGLGRKTPVVPTRVVDGAAPLISDKGLGLIANNGGALIGKVKIPTGLVANNGGNLVSNNGGGVIAKSGGALISDKGLGYRALAIEAQPMVGATVSIVDAEGKLIPDAEGRPYRATTDEAGGYSFATTPRGANLILRVELPAEVGPMYAYLPDAQAGDRREADVDAASTLVMGYILNELVKGDLALLQKLPADAEADTRVKAEAALGDGKALASFKPEAVVATVSALRAKDQAFDAQVSYVESLLVAGLKNIGEGLEATKVALTNPSRLVLAPDGALLIGERNGHRVRRVKDGRITTIAGKDGVTAMGDGGAATEAYIDRPDDVAVDAAGNVYVCDFGHFRIRRVDAATGVITTVAGAGEGAPKVKAGAVASEIHIGHPDSVVVDADGRVVFACDYGVFRVRADGTLEALPFGGGGRLTYAPDGTLHTFERDAGVIRRLGADGGVETVALPPVKGTVSGEMTIGPDGTYYVSSDQRVVRSKNGAWEDMPGHQAIGLTAAAGLLATAEHLFILDSGAGRLWKMPIAGGAAELVAGLPDQAGDGIAPEALSLNRPTWVTFDAAGLLYVADGWNGRVWQRRADGKYYRFAGSSRANADTTEIGDGGPARDAKFGNLGAIAFTAAGSLFVTDSPFPVFRVREVTPDGLVRTMTAPSGALAAPVVISAERDGGLLFSDYLLKKVVRIKDGVATDVVPAGKLEQPGGTLPMPDGSFYVTDLKGAAVYHVQGEALTLVAGGNGEGFAGDGGPAKSAMLDNPFALAMDAAGDLYVSDSRNDRVRRITMATGTIQTVVGAGSGVQAGTTADDSLKEPIGLAFDGAGNLYIADSGHNQVKVVKAEALR